MLRKINAFNWAILASTTVLCACLCSCKIGPDFHPPAAPTTRSYTPLPLPQRTSAQLFKVGQDIPGQWWTLFHSHTLNRLIRTGIHNSPNLAAMKAALVKAQDLLRAQKGESYYPTLSLQGLGEKTKNTGLSFGVPVSSIFSIYQLQLNASYNFDIFGAQRRLVETYIAKVNYARYEVLAAYLSMTSNIAINYINIASIEAKIGTTSELIKIQTNILSLVKKQFQVGGASESDVLSQKTLLAQTKATLPPLQKQLAVAQSELAILTGHLPSEYKPHFDSLTQLTLPKQLPVSIPSRWVGQRPDIQASQALLQEASAEIGVATANLLPQFVLAGNYGWISTMLSNFFNSQNSVWAYGMQLAQTLFQGGSLLDKRRAAIAGFKEAYSQYQQTLLTAFKQVSDALRSIVNDDQAYSARHDAVLDAKASLNITKKQFDIGGTNFINLLNAENQYLQIKLDWIDAVAARYTDTVTLFQVLGGGWWNNPAAVSRIDLPAPASKRGTHT